MPRVTTTKTNFAKGELAPKAIMRADLNAYGDAAQTLTNGRLIAHGGETRRPGTLYWADLTEYGPVRLETFSLGPGRSWLFVFSDRRLDVWDEATMVKQWTITPLGLTGVADPGWTAAMMERLHVVQSGVSMLVCHPQMAPQVISWRGEGNFFGLRMLEFGSGSRDVTKAPSLQPFQSYVPNVTLTPAAYTGTGINLRASGTIFSAAWVGNIVRYGGTEMKVTAYVDANNVTVDCRETLAKAWDFPVSDNAGFLAGQRIQSTAGDAEGVVISTIGADKVRVLMLDRAQPFEYDSLLIRYLVSGTTSAKLTGAGVAVATPPATYEWDEQSFSTLRGWPACAAFHEQRLVLARDNRLYLSAIADYFNFDPGFGEDDAGFAVDVNGVSDIRHIISFRHLALFCDTGEFYIPQNDSQPLTNATISVRPQTDYGASLVRPVVFDGAILFVQRASTAIREFVYTDLETAYASNAVSVLSSHLIRNPVDMDAQVGSDANEEQYAYIVNADGSMAVYHGMRKEEINGWVPWTTDGKFKAVRVVDSAVMVVVERVINGATKLYLEKFDPTITLDCAAPLAAASSSPQLAHLIGKTAHAVKGTAYFGAWAVAPSGTPDADLGAAIPAGAMLGLDFPHLIRTLPIVSIGGQNIGNLPKRILTVAVWIHESVTFDIQGHHLAVYHAGDDFGADPALKTGLYEFSLLGWTKSGVVTISQAYPLPLTILGLQLEVSY